MGKRFLTVIIVLCLAVPASAQWILGGAFSVSHTGRDKSTSIDFRPDISYSFGRISVGLSSTINFYHALQDGENDQTWDLSFAPYLQYSFWSDDHFSVFLEGGVQYARFISKTNPNSRWVPYLSPGVEFSFNDHWSLVTYLGRLEYDSSVRRISFNAAFDTISAGLYYSF